MKTVVTHIAPDLDAIGASWLLRKYLPGWQEAEMKFVPAGNSFEDKNPDENPDIIHVDTGLGKFDHHQFSKRLSATQLVFEYLVSEKHIPAHELPAIKRLVAFVTTIDNFEEVHFPDPTSDMYDFSLHQFSEGLRPVLSDDTKMVEFVSTCLEGVLQVFKNKVRAEAEIENSMIIQTSWGRALVMESKNEEATKLALKKGYAVVARRDPERSFMRIKTYPDAKYDLTAVYEKVKKLDPKATWFLHSSKHMLLNGSSKSPHSIPTTLSLPQLVEIIKAI